MKHPPLAQEIALVYNIKIGDIKDYVGKKQIKGGSRAKKMDLIKRINPELKDLYHEIASVCHRAMTFIKKKRGVIFFADSRWH